MESLAMITLIRLQVSAVNCVGRRRRLPCLEEREVPLLGTTIAVGMGGRNAERLVAHSLLARPSRLAHVSTLPTSVE